MKLFKRLLATTLGVLLLLLSFTPAYAVAQPGFNITHSELKTTTSGNVYSWTNMSLLINFTLDDNTFTQGQTSVIQLPDVLNLQGDSQFNVANENGDIIAVATLDATNRTITLTYTNFVENHSDVKGHLNITVQANWEKEIWNVKTPVTIDIAGNATYVGDFTLVNAPGDNPDEILGKNSWFEYYGTPDLDVVGVLKVNIQDDDYADVVIFDQIKTIGYNYKPETIEIREGKWIQSFNPYSGSMTWTLGAIDEQTPVKNVTQKFLDEGRIVLGTDPTTNLPNFTINFGDITKGYEIRYRMSPPLGLENGDQLDNQAKMTSNETTVVETVRSVFYQSSTGGAEGTTFTINVVKTGPENEPIEGVVFDVYRNNTDPATKVFTVTTDAQGTAEVTGLLRDTYTLVEVSAPEGYLVPEDGYVVTPDLFGETLEFTLHIKNDKVPINIPVTKVWNDANDQAGFRPDSITAVLLINDIVSDKSLTLNEGNSWSGEFTNLPQFVDGVKQTYTVKELATSDINLEKYTSIVSGNQTDGFTITNTHTPEVITLSGTKTWNDNNNQDGVRPDSITVNLLNGTTVVDTKTVTSNDNWSYTFDNLPKYKDGIEIEYRIAEMTVDNYSTSYDGLNITNTHTPGETSVTVTKAWDDANNQDGLRPEFVEIILLMNDVETDQRLVLNSQNNWTGSFTNLPLYQNGELIQYSVKEVAVDGYESVVTGDMSLGYAITNTHTPEVIELSGTKTWDDNNNQDGVRPDSITVNLLADGEVIATKDVSETDNWTYSFENLPKFNAGVEIVYTISEVVVEDYTTSYEGLNITNTHTPGETSVTVTKAWNDADNQDGIRPESVEVILLANGLETDHRLTLNSQNDWMGSFTRLPQYQNGELVQYTVKEVNVDGYEAVVTGDMTTGYVVTNTHNPEVVSVNGTKTWVDKDNRNKLRPTSIQVHLLADDKVVQSIAVSEKDKGTFEFVGLDKYINGKEIVYTIEEGKVEHYTSTINGDVVTGFEIINTVVEVPKKPELPSTGSMNPLHYSIVAIGLISLGYYLLKRQEN